MKSAPEPVDLPGQEYWEQGWVGLSLPTAVDPQARSLPYSFRRIHEYMSAQIQQFGGAQGRDLIEIGCGCSQWLPYFALQHGFHVFGLDYSPTGCAQAEEILSRAGVTGTVSCRNFFATPDRQYDVLVSFGVAEHFRPTEDCIKAFAQFLRPGGMMITETPNLSGLLGAFQKVLNRPVYDIHVPLTRKMLSLAHERAGLTVLDCRYLLSAGFTICSRPDAEAAGYAVKNVVVAGLQKFSRLAQRFDRYLPKTRLLSPYLVCTARKPPVSLLDLPSGHGS